jgi:hypothetical protein
MSKHYLYTAERCNAYVHWKSNVNTKTPIPLTQHDSNLDPQGGEIESVMVKEIGVRSLGRYMKGKKTKAAKKAKKTRL